MWFYISLLVLAALVVVWVSRTNLFRHWRASNIDPGQRGTGRAVGDYRDPDLERRNVDKG